MVRRNRSCSASHRSRTIQASSPRSTRAMRCASWRIRAAPVSWFSAAYFCASPAARRCTPTWDTSARGPIRRSWYFVVLPALLLSYAGQTAFLMDKGTVTGNPFFQIAPPGRSIRWWCSATAATIIASQAIITGSFSMTRQAMQLGWLPGVAIRQTSDRIYGQIYVPVVNWLLMVATIATTIAFGSSDRLAGAYGTAVSTTMLLTTILLYRAMRDVWRWPMAAAIAVAGVFIVVDTEFLPRQSPEDCRGRLAAADVSRPFCSSS